MKRSEMIEHIQAELQETVERYSTASDKRKPHLLKYQAEGILAMIEGFGMLPPEREITICPSGIRKLSYIDYEFSWEDER